MPLNNSKKTDRPRHLLTVKEVAELDGCSEKTVRRAIAAGRLDVVRVGPSKHALRIDPAALAAYRAASRW
jgi:excisionase family DNA binding protein